MGLTALMGWAVRATMDLEMARSGSLEHMKANGIKNRPMRQHWTSAARGRRWNIIWGGNYFSGSLPQSWKWLVWDKCQPMPVILRCRACMDEPRGNVVKMLRLNGSGLMAVEHALASNAKARALMKWCIEQVRTKRSRKISSTPSWAADHTPRRQRPRPPRHRHRNRRKVR